MNDEVIEGAINGASQTLLDAAISEIHQVDRPWDKLPKDTQDQILFRLDGAIREAVNNMAFVIASDNRPTLTATVDKVEFKDGVKAALSMQKTNPARHDLADAQGEEVLLVIVGANQYTDEIEQREGEPDQASLDVE